MDAIGYAVLAGLIPGQLDLYRFHPQALARGAGNLSVGLPIHPAGVLHVDLIGDAQAVHRLAVAIHDFGLQGFQAQGLARGTGGFTIRLPALVPAVVAAVDLIGHAWPGHRTFDVGTTE